MEIGKNVLAQYTSIKKEITDLEKRNEESRKEIEKLEKQIVRDTVTGSRKDLTIGTITVEGVAVQYIDTKYEQIRRRERKREIFKHKLEKVKTEVEEYVEGIEDSEIRRLVRFRYLDDLNWRKVAISMGAGYEEDSCRIKVERYLKKQQQKYLK